MIPFTIEENRLDDAVAFLLDVPEFEDVPSADALNTKMGDAPRLVLTAHAGNQTVGCKIGYERDGRFYSWLGAIHPQFRHHHIASVLADYQEQWARNQGYDTIWMKTRNTFPGMIIMAVKRGFRIIGLDLRETVEEHRIILEKKL